MSIINRGFSGKRPAPNVAERLPPGQYVEKDFPVLSAGPTPQVELAEWEFQVQGAVGKPRRFSWAEFRTLPREEIKVDIHCVTQWTKLDTNWSGVSVDVLLEGVELQGEFVTIFSYGGYTTNLPLADITGGKAWAVDTYDDKPLTPEHGGPARLLVPHLYFWKSAKWVRGLELTLEDRPGFWEQGGYHRRGDPWKEERYWGD